MLLRRPTLNGKNKKSKKLTIRDIQRMTDDSDAFDKEYKEKREKLIHECINEFGGIGYVILELSGVASAMADEALMKNRSPDDLLWARAHYFLANGLIAIRERYDTICHGISDQG